MSTDSNSKPAAQTAPVAQTKPSVAATQQAQQKPVLEAKYKSEDFNGAPIVKLALLVPDTMQYDAIYKLKLDSTEAVEMPLTPFFAERIGKTIKLVP